MSLAEPIGAGLAPPGRRGSAGMRLAVAVAVLLGVGLLAAVGVVGYPG